MRQPSILILILAVILNCLTPAYSAVSGKIEYSIPIDYTKLSEQELEDKAKDYFFLAMKVKDNKVNNDITNALILYNVLQNVNPENTTYPIRSGILYDKIGLDKFAKGNFSKSIGLNPANPEVYFYFGEFYYKRQMYRMALKYYNKAVQYGYEKHEETLKRIEEIKRMFGA